MGQCLERLHLDRLSVGPVRLRPGHPPCTLQQALTLVPVGRGGGLICKDTICFMRKRNRIPSIVSRQLFGAYVSSLTKLSCSAPTWVGWPAVRHAARALLLSPQPMTWNCMPGPTPCGTTTESLGVGGQTK